MKKTSFLFSQCSLTLCQNLETEFQNCRCFSNHAPDFTHSYRFKALTEWSLMFLDDRLQVETIVSDSLVQYVHFTQLALGMNLLSGQFIVNAN